MASNDASNIKMKRSAAESFQDVGKTEVSVARCSLHGLSGSSRKEVNNNTANAANASQENLCEENIQKRDMILSPVLKPKEAAGANHVELSDEQLFGHPVKIGWPQEETADACCCEFVEVDGYLVKDDIGRTLRAIFSKYGDIARDCSFEHPRMRIFFLEEVAKVVQGLQNTKFGITSSQLGEMISLVSDAARANLDVSWLQTFLERTNPVDEGTTELRATSNRLAKAARKDVQDMERGLTEAEKRCRALECVHPKLGSEGVATKQAWKRSLKELEELP